jgi:hypothetical protein
MPTRATVKREIRELRKLIGAMQAEAGNPVLDQLREDPALILTLAGMEPDPWQTHLLRSPCSRVLLNCGRQIGKSQTAAALALRATLLEPGALVLLLSPSLRQSSELFRDKVKRLYQALGRPIATKQESALTIEFVNGSRIISLPGDEGTIRGFSGVSLLVIDEASRVLDDLYRSVRPMLAVSRGSLIALSTPWGKRGWWYDEWVGTNAWERLHVTADRCPRITAAFLEEEKRSLGERFYRQEYFGSFEEVIDAVFVEADIVATKDGAPPPLWS